MPTRKPTAGVKLKRGDKVIISFPGSEVHGKVGMIDQLWKDDFLGQLIAVRIDGFPTPISYTPAMLRITR